MIYPPHSTLEHSLHNPRGHTSAHSTVAPRTALAALPHSPPPPALPPATPTLLLLTWKKKNGGGGLKKKTSAEEQCRRPATRFFRYWGGEGGGKAKQTLFSLPPPRVCATCWGYVRSICEKGDGKHEKKSCSTLCCSDHLSFYSPLPSTTASTVGFATATRPHRSRGM